ncbi:MAG: enoyl-CoA hydratase/isomerase family protein [Nitrospirae bacterium]|nr:enoyl-CoA hydratase/isomerase family protein [Nitrospirota bacterium]
MGPFSSIVVEARNGIVSIALNRPDRRNAFDHRMVTELCDAFTKLGGDQTLRAVILSGAGSAFCGGADLRWMSPDQPVSQVEAREDAERLVRMYRAIDECPCPVIGRIHGSAFGGGVGLVAVCDVAVAAQDTVFALSEVRLGLVPAVIAPFLLRKSGESFVRRYALTGESFTASIANQYGLVHDVIEPKALQVRIDELADATLRVAPQAARETKALLRRLLTRADDDGWEACAIASATARLSSEAREGLQAFFSKRSPAWSREGDK